MDKTNILQLQTEKHHTKMQDNNFKEQLSYFKIYMKVHKMSKRMVHVLSNLSTVMCHPFIEDQTMMPPNNAHDFSTNLKDDLLKK